MCGIFGCVGDEKAPNMVFCGLKQLEYRGYDSAGIAVVRNNQLISIKGVGHLDEVENKYHLSHLEGNIAIGHVRWATHGRVNQVNAHPLCDSSNQIAVVHNGVIHNAVELKEKLLQEYLFVSETDSEVIPHLINFYMKTGMGFAEAASQASHELIGPYAFLAIHSAEPECMVACCKDMPLLIGLGARACFAASDMISFSDKCKEYFALDNGDTAVIKGNDVSLMDKDGHPKPIQLRPVTSQFEQANSGNYPHFMIKEILEQPETILRALSLDNVMLETLAAKILDAKQIVFVGCGSSRHAGLLGRYLFSTIGKKFSDVIIGSEFKYYAESMNSNSLVIAISQSGETADILEGVREARKLGAKVISIINRENSQLARSSDWVIHMNCGPEISVAATKSFTSQLTVLYLLSYAMINQLEAAKAKLGLVVNQIEQVIQRSHRSIEALAYSLKAAQQCYFIARGSSFHIAIEAALKLKETAYIHSEGMPAGELKHGTLALVEAGVPFIAICPRDQTFNDMMANINEVKARGAAIIGVSDIHEEVFDHWIEIAKVEPIFYSLACIVPLQLLAYYSAVARGLNPDKPRNLAKCVTVG